MPELTKREKQILQLILQEHSSQDIAEQLEISIRTVDTHRKHILKKTKVKSLVGLVKYGIQAGLDDGYAPE